MTVIRPLEPADADALAAFFRCINTSDYRRAFAPHPFTAAEAGRVAGHRGRDLYVGVFAGETMIGYGMLRGLDEGFAVPSIGLCILAAYQGQGLGRQLLHYLIGASSERGAEEAMLKVRRDNPVARSLYEAGGFSFRDYDAEFLIGRRALGE